MDRTGLSRCLRAGSARQPDLNSDPAFHDLSGIFADEQKLVFIDYCHTTESANARIAEEMDAALAAASELDEQATTERRGRRVARAAAPIPPPQVWSLT